MEQAWNGFFIHLLTHSFSQSLLGISYVQGTAGCCLPGAVSLAGHSESASLCRTSIC